MRKTGRIFGYCLGAILLLLIIAYGVLQTSWAKGKLTNFISDMASSEGQQLALRGLSGHLPWSMGLESVSVADENGKWLEAQHLHLEWNPLAFLLADSIEIDSLDIASIQLHHLPKSQEKEEKAQEPSIFSFNFPSLLIGEANVASIQIAEETGLVTQPAIWKLGISGDNLGEERFKLELASVEGVPTRLQVQAILKEHFLIDAQLEEEAGGMLATMAGIATDDVPLTMRLQAKGNEDKATAKLAMQQGETLSLDADMAYDGQRIIAAIKGTLPKDMAENWRLPQRNIICDIQVAQQEAWWRFSDASACHLSDTTHLAFNGGITASGEEVEQLQLKLQIDDMAEWQGLAGQEMEGQASLLLHADGRLDDMAFQAVLESPQLRIGKPSLQETVARLDATTSLTGWMEQGWAALSAQTEIQATLLRQGQEVMPIHLLSRITTDEAQKIIHLEETSLKLPQVEVALEATYDLRAGQAALQGSASSLKEIPAPLNQWIGEGLQMEANLSHTASMVELEKLEVKAKQFSLNGSGSLPLAAQDEKAEIAVELLHQDYPPLTLQSDIHRSKESIEFVDIAIKTGQNRLSGEIEYLLASQLAKGTLVLTSENLNALGIWTGLGEISGTANASLSLTPSGKSQSASLTAEMAGLSLPSVQVDKVNLEAKLADVGTLRGLQAQLTASNAVTSGVSLQQFSASASSPQGLKKGLALQLAAQGQAGQQPVMLKMSADYRQPITAAHELTLQSMKGNYGNLPFQLQSPALITMKEQRIALPSLNMALAEGRLTASIDQQPQKLEALLKGVALPLHIFADGQASSIPPAIGSFTLQATGKPAKPYVTMKADITTASPLKDGTPVTLNLNTDWDNSQQSPTIRSGFVLTTTEKLGEGQVAIPASLSLMPFHLKLDEQQPISGQMSLAMALEQLNAWLAPMGHKLAGSMAMDGTIRGTLSQPDVNGTIQLQKAGYEHLVYGVCLNDMAMKGRFSTSILEISSLQATGEQGQGNISASGRIDMATRQVQANLLSEQMHLFCGGMAEGEISGNLDIAGSLDAMQATGAFNLSDMTVVIPGDGAGAIPKVEHAYLGQQEETAEAHNNGGVMTLEVDITLPPPLFVRGRGIDAELGGALYLRGTESALRIGGKLTTRRGQMEVLGSTLKLKSGEIRFLNGSPDKPYLDMQATTRTNGTDIIVALAGDVRQPSLELSSTPDLPQDEILALLIFGRPLEVITPLQAVQLAQAAATLSGQSGGTGVLGSIRDTLGIDTLNMDMDEQGGTSLGAGKYISDRVFLGVEQGTTPESRRVTTEIEITPSLKATTSTGGARNAPTVGLEWKYDY